MSGRRLAPPLALALLALAAGLLSWWGWSALLSAPAASPADSSGTPISRETPTPGVVAPATHPGPRPPEPPGALVGRTSVPEKPVTTPAAGEDVTAGGGSPGTDADVGEPAPLDELPPARVVPAADPNQGGVTVGNTSPVAPDEEVRVPPGVAWIGTPPGQVEGMLSTRGDTAPALLAYEAPRHAVSMEGYWIERTEVTEARYQRFLEDQARVRFRTPVPGARTLPEIVTVVIGERAPVPWDVETTARQLYEANRSVLEAALPGLVVADPTTHVRDEDATWARMEGARIPSGLALVFYDRAPPAHWIGDAFPPGAARHPVRGLSLADATAFALWAGRHVPTEIEWEYALRGPKGVDVPSGIDRRAFRLSLNGGTPIPQGESAQTQAVDTGEDTASWVGCLQMLGNVSEWTSSWLDPYPGSATPSLALVVDRGGSAADEDPLVVRGAYRGGRFAHAVPARSDWRQPFPWVGVRLARYDQPARDATVAVGTRVRAFGFVDPSALDPGVYAGMQGVLRRADLVFDDLPFRPGTKTIVAQPLAGVALSRPPSGRYVPGVPATVATAEDLVALSDGGLVLLGTLELDFPALDVWVERGRSSRGPPHLERADTVPGTWLVGLDRGLLVLVSPDFVHEAFLDRRRTAESRVAVIERPVRDTWPAGSASADLDRTSGDLAIDLETPLRNASAPKLVVLVRLRLTLPPSLLSEIEDWKGP